MSDESGDGPSTEWAIVKGREVKRERYIPLPDDVQAVVQAETIRGPSVFWNLERNSQWIVLSSTPVSDDLYVNGDSTKIQSPDEDWSRIRPPKALGEGVISKFYPGNDMFYLARKVMIEDDNPTVFLLEGKELMSVLPPTSDNSDDDPVDRILNNPGFLPQI